MGTYLPQNHHYFTDANKKIYDDFFKYLGKIFPDFEREQVEKKWIFKFKDAQHIVTRNYQKQITRNKKKEKIISINFANIYPEDRGINFAVREALKTVQRFS